MYIHLYVHVYRCLWICIYIYIQYITYVYTYMSILRILYRHAWKGCVCLSNVGISALPASVRDHVETCRILKIPSNPKHTQAMPQHCSAWLISPMALVATYLYSVASKCSNKSKETCSKCIPLETIDHNWMLSFTKVQYPLKECIVLSKCSNTSNAAFRLKTGYFFERLGYLVLMQYGENKACNPEHAAFLQKRAACIPAFLGENWLGNQQRHFFQWTLRAAKLPKIP